MSLDLLKTEQDRIARQVAFLDSRVEASEIEYDQARAHLDDCLALAGNAHATYIYGHLFDADSKELAERALGHVPRGQKSA